MTGRDLRTLLAHAADADPRPDADLVAAAGDPAAFTALVRRHGPLVWGTARRMLPDPADAADAFQAVFLALARSHRRIRTPAAVGGWLHAAAVRVCLKQRRQLARRRLREKRVARPEVTNPVADAAWDAILAAVHEEIDRLPAGERTAFVVCELQGVPQPEAAKRLGWKPGTLSGRLSRARARLLTALSARGFAPAAGLTTAGALAVPAEVLALAGPAASVSPAVAALSSEVTAMVTTKHLAAAVLVTAGLMAGIGGGLVAQDGGRPPKADPTAPPPGGPGARLPQLTPEPPGLAGGPAAPVPATALPAGPSPAPVRWEYEYQIQPARRQEFTDLVSNRGRAGWEYAGVVQVSDGAPVLGREGMVEGGGPAGMAGMAGEGGGPPGMGMPGGYGGMMGGRAAGPERVVNLLVFKRPVGGAAAPPAQTNHLQPPPVGGRPAPVGGGGFDPSALTDEQVRGMMRRDDADGDGRIGAAEAGPSSRLTAEVFARYDANRDGFLDATEYRGYVADRLRERQATRTPDRTATLAYDFKHIRAESVSAMVGVMPTVQDVSVDAGANRLTATVRLAEPGAVTEDRVGTLRQLLQRADQPPAPKTAAPAGSPPAVEGFTTIPLKHAKAADVARTVRELFAGHTAPGTNRPYLVTSSDDRRNLLLFNTGGRADLEEQVRKLVAELDAPDRRTSAK